MVERTTCPEALRKLADIFEAHPDLFGGESPKIHVTTNMHNLGIHAYFIPAHEQKEVAKRIRRIFGGAWTKKVNGADFYIQQERALGYFSTTIFVARDAVCERKVVGTKVVTHDAIEARPSHEETVEVYEWDCGTLLSDDATPAESGAA